MTVVKRHARTAISFWATTGSPGDHKALRPLRLYPHACALNCKISKVKALKRNGHEEVSNGRDDETDILILPSGEVTPFRLVFNAEPKTQNAWVQVDAVGNIMTSQDVQEKRTTIQGARL
ncbi:MULTISPECIES: hypothetical protein [Symbiopectobacterium]|uniref:hypothetical protein n=1 Tax=Symbiopectobacterium TaxID=801 RepID=UPI00207A7042|nr:MULTISPECIES: hypothetical protein [Symbiopectobacterium]